MKNVRTRFSLPSWKKSAIDRIDTQIDAGKKLQKRIQYLRGKDQATLPQAAWVSGQELDSWKATGGEVIDELFGADSIEQKKWHELWQTDAPKSAFDKYPEDRYLNRIAHLLAYLEGLKNSPKLARNALERVQEQLARRPLLGILMAVATVLATLFGIVRGVAWLISAWPF